jgi:hypothetical protein
MSLLTEFLKPEETIMSPMWLNALHRVFILRQPRGYLLSWDKNSARIYLILNTIWLI